MSEISIDWTAIALIWVGGVVVLVPLVGGLLRFGVAPVLIAAAAYREARREGSAELGAKFKMLDSRLRALEIAREGEGAGEAWRMDDWPRRAARVNRESA